MTKLNWAKRPTLVALVLALAVPAAAQNAGDGAGDVRLRRLEAEVAALQRQVFPGGDGKFFAPQVQPGQPAAITTTGSPATTPVTDLLARMDAVEGQLARLTAQNEETQNKLTQLEAKFAALSAAGPAAVPTTAAATPTTPPAATLTPASSSGTGVTTSTNLAAMTGGASAPKPAPTAVTPAATKPAATKPSSTPVAKPATPSAARLAAVKAVPKPATADAGDDEYSYGFRLWEAKFYPESQQQLKLYLQKYPRHSRASYARNLLGRTYLDEGNPREAASWFLQNYQAGKSGDRAPDSLLFLAESMGQLKDTSRACVALAQFVDDYPREAAGRLKAQYDATRAKVKCS